MDLLFHGSFSHFWRLRGLLDVFHRSTHIVVAYLSVLSQLRDLWGFFFDRSILVVVSFLSGFIGICVSNSVVFYVLIGIYLEWIEGEECVTSKSKNQIT